LIKLTEHPAVSEDGGKRYSPSADRSRIGRRRTKQSGRSENERGKKQKMREMRKTEREGDVMKRE
jgi:hypothetical protein